jgi:hypothetical protein
VPKLTKFFTFSAGSVAFRKVTDVRVEIDWQWNALSRSQNWVTRRRCKHAQGLATRPGFRDESIGRNADLPFGNAGLEGKDTSAYWTE